MSDIFKPNLAGTPNSMADIKFPVLVSPKIDGIRAMIHDRVMSRSMKEIPNQYVQQVLRSSGICDLRGLDGELVVGSPTDPNCMQNTTSGVMAIGKVPDFKYYVFDKFDHPGGFLRRLDQAARVIERARNDWLQIATANRLDGLPLIECPIHLVEHKLVETMEEFDACEAEYLALGYEGMMARRPDGLYKQGRSTVKEGGLLKVKRFVDGEAIIVGFEEEMKNNNAATKNELGRTKRSSAAAGKVGKGVLGAFVCKRVTVSNKGVLQISDNTFNIGTGMDTKFRAWAWANRSKLLNQVLTYKSFPVGVKDAPRHPVFKSLREKWDIS